jgi:hypothetical protein
MALFRLQSRQGREVTFYRYPLKSFIGFGLLNAALIYEQRISLPFVASIN